MNPERLIDDEISRAEHMNSLFKTLYSIAYFTNVYLIRIEPFSSLADAYSQCLGFGNFFQRMISEFIT